MADGRLNGSFVKNVEGTMPFPCTLMTLRCAKIIQYAINGYLLSTELLISVLFLDTLFEIVMKYTITSQENVIAQNLTIFLIRTEIKLENYQ